ncbi:MAG: cytidine deaminase [Firmicutes bacterium]|nr:cytidine deaminase [Bacillota bacterium]
MDYRVLDIDKKLMQETIKARENAYAPISNFRVGAAILTESDEIIVGANVEISSFSPTSCAERNAIFSYFSGGGRHFTKIAICGDDDNTFPCGVCRQVIYELSPEAIVFIVNEDSSYKVFNIRELLPNGFRYEL